MTKNNEIEELAWDAAWDAVSDMLVNAKGMYWDGCHKIYLAMDDGERRKMADYGYDYHVPNFDLLREWFANSCGLRFVSAVFTNEEHPDHGFVSLIPQFYMAV